MVFVMTIMLLETKMMMMMVVVMMKRREVVVLFQEFRVSLQVPNARTL